MLGFRNSSIIRRDEASITRIRRKRLSAAPDYPGKNSFSSCFIEISIEKDGESFSSSPKDPRKKVIFCYFMKYLEIKRLNLFLFTLKILLKNSFF